MLTADRTPPADLLADKPRKPGQFVPGDPRRRNGRPKGSRNKLAESFIGDLVEAWERDGQAVIARAIFENPVAVLQTVAKLMPAKLEISTPTDGMTDEQLLRMIELAERMAAIGATNARASMTIGQGPVSLEGVGGSPHDVSVRGEVIEGVLLAPPTPDPSSSDPLLAAAPVGDPPPSTPADVPNEDEVDPLSLF